MTLGIGIKHARAVSYFLIVMLNVIMRNVIMLNVVTLNVIMLNVIMLNAVMLNVVTPFWPNPGNKTSLKGIGENKS